MKNITHDGRVIKVEGHKVTVCFIQSSACSGCHAKGICSSQDQAEKIVVADSEGVEYSVGEKVNIIVSNEMAWSAVVLAFAIGNEIRADIFGLEKVPFVTGLKRMEQTHLFPELF